MGRDKGSYRDPAGYVYSDGSRIFRAITAEGIATWDSIRDNPALTALIKDGAVTGFSPAGADMERPADAVELIEHPALPIISYPYEWGFEALKSAALHHLDVHLAALDGGMTLSDASAFNIQFIGARPQFIDLLSFQPYRAGMLWSGYQQFIEQFLAPLLLQSLTGVPFNAAYRGSMTGISPMDLKRLVPFSARFSWRYIKHILLPTMLNTVADDAEPDNADKQAFSRGLPQELMVANLTGLRKWIAGLQKKHRKTVWGNYSVLDSYDEDDRAEKDRIVRDFAGAIKPRMLWDIGCNTGDYTIAALEAGAEYAVGWDADENAVDTAFLRARDNDLALTPLLADLANPAPDQGWGQRERMGMAARAPADAIIALALVHHLSIGRNVPLQDVGRWLTGLGRDGLVEFVPKSDPQVRRMLKFREDVFKDYDRDALLAGLAENAVITDVTAVGSGGRELIRFTRGEA